MQKFENSTEVNFVDEDNVYLGYTLHTSCCEYAGYLITKDIPLSVNTKSLNDYDLKKFKFDKDYFRSNALADTRDGGSATFRAVSKDKEEIFITLFNLQNGYYGHLFKFGIQLKSSYL